MIVVSNTSPITNLAAIGEFNLLKQLFGKIHIANGVWEELNAYGRPWPGSREVAEATWIVRTEVTERQLVAALMRDLDKGESESIALATTINADVILLDEKDGRLAAQRLSLQPVGVLGILLAAKSSGARAQAQRQYSDLIRAIFFYAHRPY